MRIGASILLDGDRCLQSHGWTYFRPVGSISAAFQYYNERMVDEIFVVGISGKNQSDTPALENARILSLNQIATPVIFGGGIHLDNIDEIISMASCDRYSISSCLIEGDEALANHISLIVGRQALVGCLPYRKDGSDFKFFNTDKALWVNRTAKEIESIYDLCDEIILYDTDHDGHAKGYNFDILDAYQVDISRTIICGGVGEKEIKLAKQYGLAAAYLENRHLHDE